MQTKRPEVALGARVALSRAHLRNLDLHPPLLELVDCALRGLTSGVISQP